jgi:hypothetical protein
MDDSATQAICSVSGHKLFARVNSDGHVTGVSNNDPERFPEPTGETYPGGDRELPVYGDVPRHDCVTEVLIGPFYQVEGDRVIRVYSVRAKLASELLAEISWWYSSVHGARKADVQRAG